MLVGNGVCAEQKTNKQTNRKPPTKLTEHQAPHLDLGLQIFSTDNTFKRQIHWKLLCGDNEKSFKLLHAFKVSVIICEKELERQEEEILLRKLSDKRDHNQQLHNGQRTRLRRDP